MIVETRRPKPDCCASEEAIHQLLDPCLISKPGGALPTEIVLISPFRHLTQDWRGEIGAAISDGISMARFRRTAC